MAAHHHVDRARSLRGRAVASSALAILMGMLAIGVVGCAPEPSAASPKPSTSAASPTPIPESTPLTAAEQLLADAAPDACAVSFVGDGIALDPQLQTQDRLYNLLPIPRADGRVFAGWYMSEADAGSQDQALRVNGSDVVACTDRQQTLHAAWTTPADNEATASRIPILMYHQFTDKPEGEDNWLRLNYAYIGDYRAHMEYIKSGGFYLPTWDELTAFIDGALYLPDRSVIITDDDADPTWLTMAQPIHDELQLMATSFEITGDGAPEQNRFILRRSHTNDMHSAGANGQGRMVNWTPEEIAADLEVSAAALGGVKEVVAYPFGHYNDTTKAGVALAGFDLGRTIEPGYVAIGTDKLALPVVRINFGMGLDALKEQIG